MASPTLTTGSDYLVGPSLEYFRDVYANPRFYQGTKLDNNLEWQPDFYFQTANSLKIAVEISAENVVPVILQRKRMAIEAVAFPVSVFAVCPEESYRANLEDADDLKELGFGLITVSADARCRKVFDAPPLQQIIQRSQYLHEVDAMPRGMKQRLAESYLAYIADPLSGVRDVTEYFEFVVRRIGKAVKKAGELAKCEPDVNSLDNVLDHLSKCQMLAADQRVFLSARGYILERNLNHHPPRSAKARVKRLRDTRHAYLEGLRQLEGMRAASQRAGLHVRFS